MKKVGFMTLVILLTVFCTLAISAALGPRVPAAVAEPAAALPAPPPHPHITEALESMRAGKHHLEAAEHDFHGHRAKAIEHLDQAIHEAEICEREP